MIKVYKENYTAISDPTDHDKGDTKEKRYVSAVDAEFGFWGDVCWVRDIEAKDGELQYIFNDYWFNMADSSGNPMPSKDVTAEYLNSFIGSSDSDPSVDVYTEEYYGYLSTLSYAPEEQTQDAQNELMKTLKSLGVLEKTLLINVLAQDATTGIDGSKKSFYPAGENEAYDDGAGLLAFTPKLGVNSDGTNRLLTDYHLNTYGLILKSDVCMVEYLTSARSSGLFAFGDSATSSNAFYLTPNGTSGCFSAQASLSGGSQNGAFIGMRRNDDNNVNMITDSSYVDVANTVGTGVSNRVSWIGRRDSSSFPATHRVAFGYVGRYLDDVELEGMRQAVITYLAAI